MVSRGRTFQLLLQVFLGEASLMYHMKPFGVPGLELLHERLCLQSSVFILRYVAQQLVLLDRPVVGNLQ